jgi:Protein of unknown function (DUF559)
VGHFKHVCRASNGPGDRGIAELARRQHGVVAYRQLIGLGFGRGGIRHRVQMGRLHRLHEGVYAVGHPLVSVHGRWMAGVLACGPGSVLSHRCAAALLGIRPSSRFVVDVTTPCASRQNRPGIEVHRTRRLDPEDRGAEDGIPITTVARTLLDLAEVVPPNDVVRTIEATERLRLFDLRAVEDVVARNPGRRGLRPLGRALEAYRPTPVMRSELERRFLDLCDQGGLPRPVVNGMVAGLEVDAAWPGAGLVVELDSRTFHGTHEAFERDRVRDATLQVAGYRVVRLTHMRMEREPEAVLRTVQLLLGAGAA